MDNNTHTHTHTHAHTHTYPYTRTYTHRSRYSGRMHLNVLILGRCINVERLSGKIKKRQNLLCLRLPSKVWRLPRLIWSTECRNASYKTSLKHRTKHQHEEQNADVDAQRKYLIFLMMRGVLINKARRHERIHARVEANARTYSRMDSQVN